MSAELGAAEAFAKSVAPAIAEARASGARSLREIAAVLNYRGIKTRNGAKWAPQTVKNALLFGRQNNA